MNNRISRINQLLKKEIGRILIREIDLAGGLITITRVETSSNLQEAGVYISVMPADQTDRVFKDLDREIYDIQQSLNKRLKMRPVPKIKFRKEERTREAARIEELLEKAKNEEKD